MLNNSNICIVPDFIVNGSKVLPLSIYIFLYIKSILEIYIYTKVLTLVIYRW